MAQLFLLRETKPFSWSKYDKTSNVSINCFHHYDILANFRSNDDAVITDVFPAKMLAQCFAIENLVTVVVLVLESKVYSTVICVDLFKLLWSIYFYDHYLEHRIFWRFRISWSYCCVARICVSVSLQFSPGYLESPVSLRSH